MRLVSALVVVALFALLASCTSTSAPTDSTPVYDGSCSAQPECGDGMSGCTACAEAGPCLDDLNRCHMSEDCLAYGQCVDACSPDDADCLNLCINAHPEGGSAYASLQHCVVCEQCSVACDGPSQGCGS
jgi:hypothetical protein